ncbi:MAG: sugar MFS transporter [Bacteroidia bacterium]|nr:sugar MFS transporter [Bacteroidia bacterium]
MVETQSNSAYKSAFALLTLLFFMWGFITVMNDVLINTFKEIFELTAFKASLVQFAFFGAFFVISLIYFLISGASGDPINKIGYKNGMIIGLAGCGLGCALFYPAALMHSYWYFLGALFVLAAGVTILQIAANPYAAILGSSETASSRLNLAQGLNSLGTTVGPLVGVLLIFKVFSAGQQTPESVGKTYLLYAAIFILCAILVGFSKLPPFKNDDFIERGLGALKFRHLALGIIAIFMYVGAEVSIGSFLVTLLGDENVAGMARVDANKYLAYYWGGLMIGRLLGAVSLGEMKDGLKKYLLMSAISLGTFLFIWVITSVKDDQGKFFLEFLSFSQVSLFLGMLSINYLGFFIGKNNPARALSIFALVIIVLLLVASLGAGNLAFWAAIGIGLFNSIMWSNIFTLAIKDLGKYTSQGSSLLVMAIFGGAVIPPIQGLVADSEGIQLSYLVPVACYLYLAWYGWKGFQVIQGGLLKDPFQK